MVSTPWVEALLAWYHREKREMPWRGHPNAYAVWISEIMLQQTQVDTVRPYFHRFLEAFPTIADLAAAADEPLLKAWEGLGYYTRVRNLRKAAQQLMATAEGQLPRTAEALKQLPGIGSYTAAAIASICFNEAVPVVDGNVARVFARRNLLTDDFSKEPNRRQLAAWLQPFIEATAIPGDFNQAMMELGALVWCGRNPKCELCPLRPECQAAQQGVQSDYPTPPKRKALPERKSKVVLLKNETGELLVARHLGERLLEGFWELPHVDKLPFKPSAPKVCGTHRQTFSHFRQTLTLVSAKLPKKMPELGAEYCWVADPTTLPLTTATRQILASLEEKGEPQRKKARTK